MEVIESLRRVRDRLLRGRRGRFDFLYSARYEVDLGASPYDPQRGERILAFLLSAGWIGPKSLKRPRRASLWDLRLAHSAAYLESLRRPESLTEIVGVEVWDELHERALQAQRAAVGGTLMATRRVLERGHVAVNLGGGFHHAAPDAGKGFCIFNDVAVAVERARRDGFDGRVLVVDLDLHDGNGTRQCFAADPTVFTFSIHNQTWDDEPAAASLDIELGAGVEDERYLGAIREHLPRLIAEHRPDLVYYLAGADPAFDDRLGNWKITPRGMLERDLYVVSQVREGERAIPLVVLLAGGYGGEAWRYGARFFAALVTGREDIEPPTTEGLRMARYRELTRALRRREVVPEEAPKEDWGLTEADIFGGLGAEARPERLLGRFSRHEVELGLEWTGFLDRLRGLGFPHTVLDFDLVNPAGQTVRLFADTSKKELLMELRLRRDRSAVEGMELLRLEWLLLQNPRASFSDDRPPLPGQKHPGLGLLGDVMALLILMCDDLELAGILFVPSHLHLAAPAKKFLHFIEPADEAWFRAVAEAVRDLPLAAATGAVEGGRVRDRRTGEPVAWRPMPMVLPTSERLHDLLEAEAYEERVAAAAAGLEFELAEAAPPTDGRSARGAPASSRARR